MVTKQQKEELVEQIKWTPKKVEIILSGYGGEIVMGTIDQSTYNWWTESDCILDDYVFGFDEEFIDSVPEQHRFIEPGSWYDCDDLAHCNNVEMSAHCSLVVQDVESGEVLFQSSLDLDDLDDCEIDLVEEPEVSVDGTVPGTCIFSARSVEKGTFFGAELVLEKPFDPKNMSIFYRRVDGWTLCESVVYDNHDLDGFDNMSTNGKSLEAELYKNV